MTSPRPEYHLRRVFADGSAGEPEVYPVHDLPDDVQLSRRGLLGTAVAVASVLTLTEQAPAKQTGKAASVVYAHTSAVHSLAATPDGKTLASGSSDNTIKLWALPGGKHLRTLTGHKLWVNALVITADGNRLISGSSDKTIKVWSLPDGRLLHTLTGHGGSVNALAATPDGKTLASGSSDNTIKLWSLSDGNLLRTLTGHDNVLRSLAITPDGDTLVSAAQDKAVKVWSLPDGKLLHTLAGHTGSVNALAATPDGKAAVSGSYDKTVRLWPLPEGKSAETLAGHTLSVNCVAITPDGKTLASGSNDKSVMLWPLPEWKQPQKLTGHLVAVRALAVTPDGKTLASGDEGGTVILWDLASGRPVSYLFDPRASRTDGSAYTVVNRESGRTVTYTLPCGSPIPPGATCVCNCVPGTYAIPQASTAGTSSPPPRLDRPRTYPRGTGSGGGFMPGRSYCSCNKICICIPVCQAHLVLHADSAVRTMAEEVLLLMGEREMEYMRWAADRAAPDLRARLHQIVAGIQAGDGPNPDRWPAVSECSAYLDSEDEVVAITAAQMLQQHGCRFGRKLTDARRERVRELLEAARERPWYVRAAGQDGQPLH